VFFFESVGHTVKIHKITPVTGHVVKNGFFTRDLEVKTTWSSKKPQKQDDRLPPPRTLGYFHGRGHPTILKTDKQEYHLILWWVTDTPDQDFFNLFLFGEKK
jgi:hypothetical protein